jgi:hypothetical protein
MPAKEKSDKQQLDEAKVNAIDSIYIEAERRFAPREIVWARRQVAKSKQLQKQERNF